MTRDELKDYINEQEPDFLDKARHNGYVCPYCGQGANKGNGITRNSGNRLLWHCVNENKSRSVTGLYAGHIGIEDTPENFPRILEEAAKYYNIPLDWNQNQPKNERSIHTSAYTQQHEQDYTEYFKECKARIGATDYPARRGLSPEVVERFNLGYDPAWKNPKTVAAGKNPPATPRLIIPTSSSSYLARDTRPDIPEGQKPYSKMKVGSVHLFNLDALDDPIRPCFVVEGEIDALSIIDVGGNALALGSTTSVSKFLGVLADRKPKQPLVIALDNDPPKPDGKLGAGAEAALKLEEGLKKLGLTYYRRNPCGDYKDANEALQKNREELRAAVETVNHEGLEEYNRNSVAAYLQSFIDGIADSVNTPCIRTGFERLDNILDGGLYEGLYVIGGISSLGKTSVALQIFDQIAQGGEDVLIFSLEMARAELMAKSISRHTFTIAHERYKKDPRIANGMAKTARGITDGKRYQNYNKEERELINDAVKAYSNYAKNIFISEGVGDIGVNQIREAVEKHIRLTGKRPLVLVDYLQILAPYSERATDKQNTDKAVLELKRISRDYKTSVLAISSLNRMSYTGQISMEAFKESGAIEYSADVLLGLQLSGADRKDFDATKEKQKDPREIELIILKNRNGAVGKATTFEYYPRFNYFEETKEPF